MDNSATDGGDVELCNYTPRIDRTDETPGERCVQVGRSQDTSRTIRQRSASQGSIRQAQPSHTPSIASGPLRQWQKQRQEYILRACCGLMSYGAPTHRLEDYMSRTAAVLGLELQSFHLPGCMFISFGGVDKLSPHTHILRCDTSLNLSKLYQVHAVYKEVIHNKTDVEGAIRSLDAIAASKDIFPRPLRVILYGLASMCIGPISYGAHPIDLPLIFVLGSLLGISEQILAYKSQLFLQVFEITTTVIIAFLARALGSIHLPHNQSFCFPALCQASLVMILPGFIVTNSALELQCKHIVTGSVRLVYGLVFIFFLAFGITIGTTIYGALDASASSATSCSSGLSVWWQIMFVPLFTLAWVSINQAPWKKMPAMVFITLVGWLVNHFSGLYFQANTIISQTLGALSIGILANIFSRVGHEVAVALLYPAVFIQVPGSLAASGGLTSGVQIADALNGRTSNGTDVSRENLLTAGYSMLEIAIAITVGLSISVLLVYPFRKRTHGSGIFSF